MRAGFIGTGVMGNAMARCIIEAGHELTVYDIRREATANLCEMGARWADGPRAAAAASDIVFTSLPGPREMEEVVLDPQGGVLAGLRPGACYVDTTTNWPATFLKVAKACQAQGVEVLDAPVSARPPEMTMMIGGDASTLAKCRPILDAMAKNIFHLGDLGQAMVAKLVTQYMGYTNFIAAAEGMLMAAKAGLDLGILAEIVPVSAGGSRMFSAIPRQVLKRQFAGEGSLDIIVKDMEMACELARLMETPATLGHIASDVFKRAKVEVKGPAPFYNAVQVLERMAGVELRAHGST